MALVFDKPTDKEKERWARSETIARADLSGQIYELSERNELFVLERLTPAPSQKKTVGYLKLVGYLPTPTETLIERVRLASTW